VAISAAMLEGTGLTELAENFPNRVFDVGIAEAHAVTFAAGLATSGIVPIVAIYSSFLQRAFDNIIHDCALQNLHIVFALDRAGIVGEDGPTHHGVFDIAYLRIIPNMVVMAPKDRKEFREMLYCAIYDYTQYCVAIRYPRGKVSDIDYKVENDFSNSIQHIQIGKSEILAEGKDICIIALGKMVSIALEVNAEISKQNISVSVINARFVKPLDTKMLDEMANKFSHIITLEDGVKMGGLGSAVIEYFNNKGYTNKITILGIDDKFVEHGNVDTLLAEQGLNVPKIVNTIKSIIS
jgi:1-deoxy-D-xylulose-5-phosphate synthase